MNFINEADGSHLLPQFVEWMDKLDESRDESFVDVFPEWKPVFAQFEARARLTRRYVRPMANAAKNILDKVGLGKA